MSGQTSLLFLVLLFLFSQPLLAQPPVPRALEAQLESAVGEQRLALLVALASHYREDEPEKTIAAATEALELLETYPHRGRQVEILLCLSEAHVDLKEHDVGLSYASRAEVLATPLKDPSTLARVRYHSGRAYLGQRQFEQAIDVLIEAKNRFEKIGNINKVGRALARVGDAYQGLNDLDRALAQYLESANRHQEVGNHSKAHFSLALAGRIHHSQGEYEKALEIYLQSYELALKGGRPLDIAASLNNVGTVYAVENDYGQALDFFQRALEVGRREGDRQLVATNLNNIGWILLQLDRYTEAVDAFLESLEIRKALGEPGGSTLYQVANAYQELGEHEQAERYYLEGLEESRRSGSKEQISLNLHHWAQALQRRGDLPAAQKSAEEALEVALEVKSRPTIHEAQLLLSEIHAEQGRFEEALDMFKRHTETKSEIFNEEKSRTVAEMQAAFEADERERVIELLEKDRTLQRVELKSQSQLRRGLLVGFGLLLAVLALLFNRYRLKSRESQMRDVIEREREVSTRLREVDKFKDEFLANTSHELRTPLYGITGLAESLIDGVAGELPEEAKDNLAMVVASGRRLTALVNDILDFSKLRHKSLEINPQPIDLRSLTEVVLTVCRPLAGSKNLEIRNAVAADLPVADADENRLQQILYNLVGNAIKFTEAGSVEVSASVKGGKLEVRVADTGIGIPEAQQERIFDAFEQADASVERDYGGTGLGLAVSGQLVELHGGTIGLESALGVGSTFSFSLPLAARAPAAGVQAAGVPAAGMPGETTPTGEIAASQHSVPSHPIVEKEDVPSASLRQEVGPLAAEDALTTGVGSNHLRASDAPPSGGPRVLVVDDEPVNLQVVKNYLSLEHFDLVTASSGDQALRLIQEQSFDLVLLDVMMPRISGYEVCRVLRETHAMEDLPVLFLTAKNQISDVVNGLSLGANDYLTKPIARDELLARVRPHLDLLHVHRNLENLVAEKMSEVKVLEGLLSICAECKKIRDDEDHWNPLETYIDSHSEASFSHGLCPDCLEQYRSTYRL